LQIPIPEGENQRSNVDFLMELFLIAALLDTSKTFLIKEYADAEANAK
jgi:hypothetical protein